MKVCRIENFPGDKVECRNCGHCLLGKGEPLACLIAKQYNWINGYLCPSEGCRPDCPLIPCEGIKDSLEFLDGMVLYEGSVFKINDDSIKFIKACEDNQ